MKLTDLKIDRKCVGKMLLVDVVPAFRYENGHRTDTIDGYRYICALPDHGFDKIAVKILGEQQMERPDSYVEVACEGLELRIYWTGGEYQVGATATGIKPVVTG